MRADAHRVTGRATQTQRFAVAAYSCRCTTPGPARAPRVSSWSPSPFEAATVHVAIALSGFCALAGEVVWTRLLSLMFGATTYAFSIILGVFLFGTSRVGEFLEKGFPFQSVGNDLHHILTQAGAYVKDVEGISKGAWKKRPSSLV
jgi:hypothetical protein